MKKKESKFQAALIKRIIEMYPEAIVLKNDPNYRQGIPDLVVLYRDKYAILECKRDEKSPHRPNQLYYIKMFSRYTVSSFVYPQNLEEIINAIQKLFDTARTTCIPRSE